MMRSLFTLCLLLSSGFAFEDPFALYPRPKQSLPTPELGKSPEVKAQQIQKPVETDVQAYYPLPLQLAYDDPQFQPILPSVLVQKLKIPLRRTPSGIRGPNSAVAGEPIALTIDELNALDNMTPFYASALDAISQAVSQAIYKKSGYIGVFCSAIDQRRVQTVAENPDKKEPVHGLDLAIEISECGSVRTISEGPGADGAVDTIQTAFIRRDTPVKKGQHLKKEKLSDYALYLSRYPDRRVDVEFHPLETMGEVGLDYIVQSTRPWHIFAAISNTGTNTIGQWIASFGFIHNQFFLRDAIARLEYATTARFKNYHTVRASYEVPLFKVYRTRFRAHFGYMRYSSTQLGITGPLFVGRQTMGGGTFLSNLYQKGNFFIDGEAGLTFRAVRIINRQTGMDSNYVRFFNPRFGASFDKRDRAWSVNLGLGLVTTINGAIVGSSHKYIDQLGSANVSNSWLYLDGYFSTSLYIDSLTNPEKGPLANEIRLISAGQFTPKTFRLAPQFKGVVGGMHTVRGYPESFISGDSTVAMSGEYLIHIPRLFRPSSRAKRIFGETFYAAPPRPGALPSWDLILKLFVDAGGAHTNRRQSEPEGKLFSAGGGLDLNLMNHFILRSDIGVVLKKTTGTQTIDRGHTRFSLSATLFY